MKTPTKSKTMTDKAGRTWTYSDGEGSWGNGQHIIGCGRNNESKWQIWNGPKAGYYEYKTLREAMAACE